MRASRLAISRTILVGVACGVILVVYTWYASVGRLTHGFISYYTAAQVLLEGRMGPQVYDDDSFRTEIQRRTSSGVLDIFGPNPPTMAILALPVAGFEPATARTLWLLTSLLALSVTAFFLVRDAQSRRARFLAVAIAVLLLSPAVFANLRTAQAYLLLGACFAGTAIALSCRRDTAAGLCLGVAVILKTAGVPWLLVLAAARRWRALGVALGTVTVIGMLTLPWTGLNTWLAYPAAVTAFVSRPSTGVTAYQTTVGFVRHFCVFDAQYLGGVATCNTTATIAPILILALAVAITLRAVRQAPANLASAAGVCLSLLCVPIAEDHHFVLLAVPLFALLTMPIRLAWLWVVALLFLVPPELTVQRFTAAGWLSLLAYPRLYATWLTWTLTIHAIRRKQANRGAPFISESALG